VNGLTVTTYREIFKPNNERCRNVFIVGEAGSGKSSLSQHIAHLWSEENKEAGAHHQSHDANFTDVDTIQEFEFLFHVALRDSCNTCNYVDMIRNQLLQRLYKSQDIDKAYALVEEVLETSHCLILADGRDEWSHPDGPCTCTHRERGIRPLIHQKNSATVLLTSRPVGFTKIPEHKVDNYLEIEGAKDVQQLCINILNVLNGNTDTKGFAEFEISLKENGLWDNLSQSPILLIQMICLWYDNHELSKSVSITYASIFDMLIGRAKDEVVTSQNENLDNKQLNIIPEKDNINSNWKQFTELCKLAFEKLFAKDGRSAVVFSTRDCKDDIKTFAVKCGILTEKKSKSVSFNSHHLSFQHKTFQEFLASVHLSLHDDLLATDIEPRYYNEHKLFQYYEASTKLERIFVFMCALNGNTAEKMSEYLKKLEEDGSWGLISKGFREALYAGNTGIELACPCKIEIVNPCGTETQAYIRWIKKNQHDIRYIKLTKHEQNMDSLFRFLQNLPQLEKIHFSDMKLDVQLQLPCSVTTIELEKVTVTRGDFLHHHSQLQTVELTDMDMGDLELQLPSSVTNIKLWRVTVTRWYFLHHLTQLQTVTLSEMDLGDLQLQLPNSVTTIRLWTVKLTRWDFLDHLPHLQTVGLYHMDLGDMQLQNPSRVTTIEMSEVTVTRWDFLHHLPQLQTVRLYNMDLGDLQLQLPSSVTTIELAHVTVTRGDFLHHLPQLQTVRLFAMDLFDFQLQLPSSVNTIELMGVDMWGDFLHHLPQLQTVKLYSMDLGDLQFPPSVTEVELNKVAVSVEAMLRLVESLEQITHDVKCSVVICDVYPVDQIKRAHKRLQQSTCLKIEDGFKVDSESIVSFKLAKC